MAEDKALEPVTEIKENGAEKNETAKHFKDEVVTEEKADINNLEEMQVDTDPEKDSDTIDEKVNETKVDCTEEDKIVENNDVVVDDGKKTDTANKISEATVTKENETETAKKQVEKETETTEKEVEKEPETVERESESEKPDDTEGKQDGVVAPNGISDEGQESEKEDEEEKDLKKPGTEKSGTKKANGKSKDVQEPKTPAAASFSIDRPVRERKSTERLVAVIERDSSKEFQIEKGNGTALKGIPNVAYKLSRRKNDDTLKLLHSILFTRRGKATDIKQHISKFSGFVWQENEEKQKLKIKDKLEKCNKEKMFEFCDILDLTIASKANIRKDEVVTMLLDFLITPHPTTDELLAEKEEPSKGSKRKRADKGSGSTKSRKKQAETSKSDDKTNSAETEDESAEDVKEGGMPDEVVTVPEPEESTEELTKKSLSEEKLSEPDTQTDEDTTNKKRKRIPKKYIEIDERTPKRASNSKKTTPGLATETSKGKTKKNESLKTKSTSAKATPRSSKKPTVDADKDAGPKVSSKKQKDVKPVKEKTIVASEEKAGKNVVSKGKEGTGEELTDERIREETCKILKEVDFNTATFSDILKILAERFKTDLTPRKLVIKVMVQEELTKLANEESDDEEDAKPQEEVVAPKDKSNATTSQKV